MYILRCAWCGVIKKIDKSIKETIISDGICGECAKEQKEKYRKERNMEFVRVKRNSKLKKQNKKQ